MTRRKFNLVTIDGIGLDKAALGDRVELRMRLAQAKRERVDMVLVKWCPTCAVANPATAKPSQVTEPAKRSQPRPRRLPPTLPPRSAR